MSETARNIALDLLRDMQSHRGFTIVRSPEVWARWREEWALLIDSYLDASLAACREQLAASEQRVNELRATVEERGREKQIDDAMGNAARTRYTALHRAASQLARMLPGGDSVLMGPIPNCCVDELGAVENGIADLCALLTEPAGGSEEKACQHVADGTGFGHAIGKCKKCGVDLGTD